MIFVYGLDAFAWERREHLRAHDYHVCRLHSPYAKSAPAWNSIFSGLTAERHGYAGQPDAQGEPVLPNRPPYVWDHLLTVGKQSVVVNVPFLWPPSFCRLMVCGYPSPAGHYAFPRAAEAEWPHEELDLVRFAAAENLQQWPDAPPTEVMRRLRYARWSLAHRLRVELAKGLPALTVFCLTALDRLGHLYPEALREALAETVEDMLLLGDQVATGCGAEWTVLVSDHGMTLDSTRDSRGRAHAHGPGQPGTEYGIFAWRGPGAAALPEEAVLSVEDVAPTLLWLLDCPPAYPMEGKVAEGIRPSVCDEAATQERLRALGYVD